MPTKTEAADLLMALYGRHGESPLPVVAAVHPVRLLPRGDRGGAHRGQHRTPVILLSRHVPRQLVRALAAARRARRCPRSTRGFATEPNQGDALHALPARRQAGAALGGARARPGLRHRIGGLEKEDVTGNISYQPENHDHMTRLRAERDRARGGARPGGGRPGRRRRRCSCSAGGRATARSRAPRGALRREQGAEAWPPPTSATSTRCRATSARCCAPTSGCWCPR